jgi:hypothetical protein
VSPPESVRARLIRATSWLQLIQKISRLPATGIAEVEDFVDFLAQRDRDSDRQLAHAATAASEPAFAKVWNNPEDDVYA